VKVFALEPVVTPCGHTIALWQLDLKAEPSTEESSCLSQVEWQRARRFVFERDRQRFIAAHTALRHVLGEHLLWAPAALAFAQGPHGKPFLIGKPQSKTCHFNLSHSADVAWVGISNELEIGVDLEVPRQVSDAIALARRNYTPAELAEVESAPDQNRAFFTCWTRKEACLKAIGSGFSVAPESFECGALPDTREVQITHEKTLGRSQVFSPPSGGLAQSDRSGGALKSIAGPLPRLTCPHGGPDGAEAASGGLVNPQHQIQRAAVRSLIRVDDDCIGAVAWILENTRLTQATSP
jgi:4'-phosphopantetheinyl transferase